MTRICTECKTPISSHVLVVDNQDFHRKSCYCSRMGHRLEGDRRKPGPCMICEPRSASWKNPDQKRTRTRDGRKPRTVMIVT